MKTFVHEEVYRGKETLDKIAKAKFTICGLGAIGSNLVMNMARQSFTNFTVIDFDRIEDHNRHTQIWGAKEVGQMKAAMMQRRMYDEMGLKIQIEPKKLDEANIKKLVQKDTIVIDGFDNTEARGLVTTFCTENKIQCLHIGMRQDYAEVIWNENYIVPKKHGKDICEYPLARNIILLAVAVGTETILRYVDTGVKENYAITLKDCNISKLEY